MDSGLALRAPRNDDKKKGRDRSRPYVGVDGRVKPGHDDRRPQFEARFGGLAGHDLISVS